MPVITNEAGALRVVELLRTIAGETTHAGRPALFVRLAGCNLDCFWCDTPQRLEKGRRWGLEELRGELLARPEKLVVITGGEPLLQQGTAQLCRHLVEAGREVLVETNGSLDITVLSPGCHIIMDIKPPSSGQSARMCLENIARLHPGDEIKMVVADRDDFDWCCRTLEKFPPPAGVEKLFSPVWGRLAPAELARWVIEKGMGRLQLQLHKIIWPDGEEGVPF